MIKRLMVLAALGGAAVAATALLAQPAEASTPSNGNATDIGCFAVDQTGCSEYADITVTGSVSAGTGHATAAFTPHTSNRVLRTQIDDLGLELGPPGSAGGVAGSSGPVTGGQPGRTLHAGMSVPLYVAQYPPCQERFRVSLTYSARFADGSLHKGRYRGPWFDTGDGPCASGTSLRNNQIAHCMVHFADGSVGACLTQRVDILVSNDGHRIYGRGQLVLGADGGSDRIARLQVDHVRLSTQHGVIAQTARAVNSGTRTKPYDAGSLTADSETLSALWRACGTHYTVTMDYSVRYTNGTLYHGQWVSTPYSHC